MRQLLYLQWFSGLSLWLLSLSVRAQVSPTANQNYIVEQSPRTGQSNVNLGSNYTDVPATVSYVDGLGRPLQTVQVRGSGDGSNDIVTTTTTYDAYGRTSQTFLPVPGAVGGGGLQTNPQGSGQSFYSDSYPYQQTIYEASPLNRPSQQWGAGQNWRSANRSQGIRYGVASPNTVLRFTVNLFSYTAYAHPEGDVSHSSYFGPNDIAIRTVTDEQNNQTVEYTDLQGRMVRRDVMTGGQTLTTMYVYDVFERLALVIPPKLYNWFVSGDPTQLLSFSPYDTPDPRFKDNAYAYLYDARGRQIRKHVPSAGWTELVYDWQDRLVMSQDQQDKAASAWRFSRYDGLSRVVETGRVALNSSGDELRTAFAGVSNENFPSSVVYDGRDLLTVNTYDNYTGVPLSFDGNGAFSTPWPTATGPNATGLLTRSGVRNLATGAFYSSAFWYDDKGRVIQQQRQHHLGGTDRTDFQYQFNGELLQSVLRHQKLPNGDITTVISGYGYDHLGRRKDLTHQLGSGSVHSLAHYTYDGIGRLSQKGLESTGGIPTITRSSNPPSAQTTDVATQSIDITPNDFNVNNQGNTGGIYDARIAPAVLQTLDYRYHIRGWLRGINCDATGQPVLNASRNDAFAFGLDYETAGYYDGSIGKQRWLGSRLPNQTRQYTYDYDGASRLTSASYSGAPGEDYSLSGMSYDQNGNITSLTRTGIDQLSYSYAQGNSLTAVSDGSSNTAGFNDGNSTGADYEYWPEGSLKKDLNRGITEIQYNLLKLPQQISFSSGKVVQYQYDAQGQKLHMSSTTGDTLDYVGVFQYRNKALFEVSHEEGRVAAGSSYEYYLTDHLGNIRAVVGSSGVSQWVDYDPWGLELAGLSSGSSTNRMKFNGQEAVTELGGGLIDHGARLNDVTIGRWGVVDPLANLSRSFSPFAYGNNNPVRITDPDGMAGRDEFGNVTFNGFADVGLGGYVIGNVQNLKQGQSQESDSNNEGGPGPRNQVVLLGGANLSVNGTDISDETKAILNGVDMRKADDVRAYNQLYLASDKGKVEDIVSNILANYTSGQKVIIYGYSYGGVIAQKVVNELAKSDVTVDLLITVDAANGRSSNKVDRSIPINVLKNINFYQTSTDAPGLAQALDSRGGPNSGINVMNVNQTNMKFRNEKINHSNIDNLNINRVINLINKNL